MKMLFDSIEAFKASLKPEDITKTLGGDPAKGTTGQRTVSDFAIKAVDNDTRTIVGVINALRVDRDGEVLLPRGCLYEDYLKNPVVLLNHLSRELPVANTLKLEVSDQEIVATIQFLQKDANPIAEYVWLMYSRKHMRAFSHSFLRWEQTERPMFEGQMGATIMKWELLEVSCVTVQSLREALVTRIGKTWDTDEQEAITALSKAMDIEPQQQNGLVVAGSFAGGIPILATNESILPLTLVNDMRKAITGTQASDRAAIGERWKWSARDANAIIDQGGFAEFKNAHAWTNNGLPIGHFRSASHLPHHKLFGDKLKVVFRGVKACMCGLLGSVVINEKDYDNVYKHLADHWRAFGYEPPPNKPIAEQSDEWKKYFGDLDEGELRGALVPWEDALVPPYVARVIEFPSLDAAVKRLTLDLAEAQGDLKEGRVISTANLKKLQAALTAISTAVKELNKLLSASKPRAVGAVQDLKTLIDILEIEKDIATIATGLKQLNL